MSVTGWVRMAVLATAVLLPVSTLQAGDDCRRGNRGRGKHYKNSRSYYRGGGPAGYYGGYGGGRYYGPPVRRGYYAPPPRRVVVVERPVPVPVYTPPYGYGYYPRGPRVSIGVGVVIP